MGGIHDMNNVSTVRLYLLRAMYLLIAAGLAATVWPHIISPPDMVAGPKSVIRALLGALAVMSLLGLRYPLQMLPLLLFELLWKVIWVVASAVPMWLGPGLDAYASETLFACLMGVVLVPIVIPWGYVSQRYIRAAGDPWRRQKLQRS
jgi:membrane associated rhomboid family serine protease